MNGKLRVGLDLDGVVCDFEQHFLEHLKLPLHHAESWSDERFRDNFHKVYDDYFFWMTIPPIFDPKLLKFVPTIYVTARPIKAEVSKDWLNYHGFPDAPVVCVGMGGDKSAVLKHKVDVFLDDAYHNYVSLNEAGIHCLLVTRPHNTKYEVSESRVEGVLDFQEKFSNLI